MPTYSPSVTQFSSDGFFRPGFFCFFGNYIYIPDRSGYIAQLNLDGTTNNAQWFDANILTPGRYINGVVGYFDGSNNYLYATQNVGRIYKILINNDGTLGTSSLLTPILVNAYGIVVATITGNDYLIVVDYTTGLIMKILISTGLSDPTWQPITQSGSYGCVIYKDYVYVANTNLQGIYKISLTNSSDNTVWQTSSTVSGCLDLPYGIVVYNNYFYVSNPFSSNYINQISINNPIGNNKANWINPTTPQTSITEPLAMSVYNDVLYIDDYSSGYIYRTNLPPIYPCFKEDSKILTDQGYKLVQDLRKGDLVKTLRNDYLPVVMIGKRDIHHDALEERVKDQLYQYSNDTFEEVFEPLVLTGCHSILVDEFVSHEEREKTTEVLGKIYVTDNKYRLPACVDERASVYEVPGDYTIYHIALENEHYTANYGIYANGLLVESCSKRYLKELSEMEILE